MAAAVYLCVSRWDRGVAWRFLPPIAGAAAGALSVMLHADGTPTLLAALETIGAYCAAGWVFWFAVWVERRRR
jgi:hypothetical protein